MRRLLPILALLLAGCPGFEDEYSGTYRQALDSADPGAEPLAIEVFRYGHNVQAMVRFYANDAVPFSRELRCAWTDPTRLSDDLTFETLLQNATTQLRLSGRFDDGPVLQGRVNAVGGNSPDLTFERVTDVPDDDCATLPPRSVRAKFGGLSSANEFPVDVYEIQNPYLGIQWIAVQPIQTGTVKVWTAFLPELVFAPVASKITTNRRGLTGEVSLLVEPPDPDYRTVSGDTRYSLAHFIVVDDEADDTSFVSWDRATEPIIAAGVRGGTRPGAPEYAADHDQYGLALLFVEGRLDQLGSLLDIIEIHEDVEPDAHYYVAQVYAESERIVGLRIEPTTVLTIPVTVTTDYLTDPSVPLPRLFPLD